MDLFSFHDDAPGMPFFHPKGMDEWNALLDFWRDAHREAGLCGNQDAHHPSAHLVEKSGHWENYRENMYTTEVDDQAYAIKPMNCPGGMLLYSTRPHSYRELPIRAAEIGLVHRHEMSGVLNGLFRVRAFHQDDAHLFMMPDQIQGKSLICCGWKNGCMLLSGLISTWSFPHGRINPSARTSSGIRPPTVCDQPWMPTQGVPHQRRRRRVLWTENRPAHQGCPGPNLAVRGPSSWDMSLPERFDLTYVGKDNEKHRPIMLHRTVFGSIERFLGILIEHFERQVSLMAGAGAGGHPAHQR